MVFVRSSLMMVMVMSVVLKRLKLTGPKMKLVDGKWMKYPILNKYVYNNHLRFIIFDYINFIFRFTSVT